ncbi:Cellobiose transport system permease protein OS=Streptomyces albaduncus OX=68172 GN=FHS32_005520 PE=3 SV=1 [Streptomyces griseoloalbus]
MRNETALGLAEARGPWARVLRFVLYAALFMVFAGPLLALMVGAFTPTVDPTQFTLWPDRLSLDNLERAVDRNVLDYLLNSFLVVGGGLALQVLVSVFAGYALARKRFRGSAVVLVLILATMMLPEEVLAVPLSVLLADLPLLHVSLVGSLVGMIVPVAAGGSPSW